MKINEDKLNVAFVIISLISLVLSISKVLNGILPFDIAWVSIILCGFPIIIKAIIALVKEHDIKADVLVSIALIGSLYIKEYFAAGEVAFIMALGGLLEDFTSAKAKAGIEKLIKIMPQTARVRRNGKEEIIKSEDVQIGDTIIVLAGETIPVDGTIIKGETSVNQASMTGESLPVDKKVGDEVISGTINEFGTFEMTATKVGENSSIQRMVKLAKEADENKANIVHSADKWATWFVLVAFACSILTGIITHELIRAVTVLVVFCPCAFILATPTAIIAGIANASRNGILVRSGDSLERFNKITHIALDKTGTITKGKPQVIGVEIFDGSINNKEFLSIVGTAENHSEHPLGKAIIEYCKKEDIELKEINDFKVLAGMGISANIDNKEIIVGRKTLLKDNKIEITEEILDKENEYLSKGATTIFIGINGKTAGFIAMQDEIKTNCKEVIEQIKSMGIEPILLTGDNEASAKNVCETVGINTVYSKLMPEDKMKIIENYKKENKNICMIGDGINDSLALKNAYTSVAMGGIGSDIAVESADAVLVTDNIEKIPYLINLSKVTLKRIKINIIGALIWNIFAAILSMTGILSPITAALVHNFGSVAVVISSALILVYKKSK